MRIKRNKIFIIVFASLFGLAAFAFKGVYKNSDKLLFDSFYTNSIKDTNKTSFQSSIDEYCKLLNAKDSIINKKKKIKTQIKENEKNVNTLTKREKEIENELSGEKIDSCKIILKNELINIEREIGFKNDLNSVLKKQSEKLSDDEKAFNKKVKGSIKEIQSNSSKLLGAESVNYLGVRYNFFVADLDSNEVRLHWKNPKDKKIYSNIGALLNELKTEKLKPLMITNGGMYLQNQNPEGLYIENRIEKVKLDTTDPNNDNFYLKPNGVFYIDTNNIAHIDTTEAFARFSKADKNAIKIATQSGPMLVINNRIHPAFIQGSPNYKIRSGVGVMTKKRVVFAISMTEANFFEFSSLFKDIFKCENALFLDGAISLMYLRDINPTETGGHFGPMISVTKKK